MRIFVIDSGIGGLSVLDLLKRKYPLCDYVYFSDNANHPYGERSDEEINKAILSVINSLDISKKDVLVVACNTASTTAKNAIENFPINKVYYVEPNMDEINSLSGRTLVLATNKTIENIRKYAGKNVTLYAPSNLPKTIENAKSDTEIVFEIKKIKKRFKENFDNVVLACTHFSIKKHLFREVFEKSIIYDTVESSVKKIDVESLDVYSYSSEPSITYKTSSSSISEVIKLGDIFNKMT